MNNRFLATSSTCEVNPSECSTIQNGSASPLPSSPRSKGAHRSVNQSIYAKISAGTFPKQIAIGPNTAAWIESEIDAYNAHLVTKARLAA